MWQWSSKKDRGARTDSPAAGLPIGDEKRLALSDEKKRPREEWRVVLRDSAGAGVHLSWHDGGIQAAYRERSRFQLLDSAGYYLAKVAALAAPAYVPSVEDVVKTRVRTSGIIEESYDIGGVEFLIYDVGGQVR